MILAVKGLIFTDGDAEAQSAESLVQKWVQGRIRTRISSSLLILGFCSVIPGFLLYSLGILPGPGLTNNEAFGKYHHNYPKGGSCEYEIKAPNFGVLCFRRGREVAPKWRMQSLRGTRHRVACFSWPPASIHQHRLFMEPGKQDGEI